MKKVKWGIAGLGKIAHQFAHDFVDVQNGELVGVASRSAERGKEFSEKYNAPKIYTNYQDLYNDDEIDAVYIATPHNFHLEMATEALKAGKAVLCEKPITINPDECRELMEVAKATGGYLMEGMWTYFLPALLKAQEWVAEGRIGKVKHVKSDFGYPVPFDSQGRMYNPNLAGGALLDMGIYTVAMAWLFYKKDPIDISVVARNAPTGVDNDVTMLFEYDDELANLTTSFRSKLPNWTYIVGEGGNIAIPDFWRAKECFLYEMEECVEHFKDPRSTNGFNFEIDAVSEDILQGRKESEVMPLAYSLKLQEQMWAVMQKFGF